MDLKCEVYGALCQLSEFEINGIEADYGDFGTKYDESPDTAADYACGNMIFVSDPVRQEILDKYKITEKEYNKISIILEDKLTFGLCSCCV